MSTEEIQPGNYGTLTRRTFISALFLAALGCQERRPTGTTPSPQPTLSPSPSHLQHDPGRVVVQTLPSQDSEPVNSVWRIASDGTAKRLQRLPSDLVAPLQRVGQGDRICYYIPTSEEGAPVLIKTVELLPDDQVKQGPDRMLEAFADPHLYFCESDLVLASQPTDHEPYAELVFVDKTGLITSSKADLLGVVEVIASDGEHLAVITSSVGLDGALRFGPLVLYERRQTTLIETSSLVIDELNGGGAFPTGLSFLEVDKTLYLSLGIEAGHPSGSAILTYKLADGTFLAHQRLAADSRPGPLQLANEHSAFYQNGLGQTLTYRWRPSGWESADELRSTGFGASPQSQKPGGIVYLSNNDDQILCAQVDSQAQLGPVVSISESLSQADDQDRSAVRHSLLIVLD